MKSIWPKYLTFKNVFAQSARSRIDPTHLTPTNKLTFAKARIWQEVIGGNQRTSLSILKKPLTGESSIRYYEYAFRDFYLPFNPAKDEYFHHITKVRAMRESRKGKTTIHQPSRTRYRIPKYDLKRFLQREEKRKQLMAEANSPSSGKDKKAKVTSAPPSTS